MTPIKVFADSSVMYSAVISREGGSREVLRRHLLGDVQIVISDYVVMEIMRNLNKKAPVKASLFEHILKHANLVVTNLDKLLVLAAAEYVELKDAPIIAAAQYGGCAILFTYDRKHLIDPPEVAAQSGLKIMTPGTLLQRLLL